MSGEDLPTLLSRFGLSDKEIDTYLALLRHGEAKASTVADDADVSKRYVYSVSESLEEKGFVEVNDHVVPTTIRARPPEEVVVRLQEDVEAMRPGLEERYSETEPVADQFEIVKSKATVVKRIKSLIGEAEEEITLSIPAEHVEDVAEELRAAVDRGVLVVLLVTGVDDLPEVAGLASVTRTWKELMPTMLTIDSEIGLVAPSEMLLRSNADSRAIVFAQEQLAPVIVGSFFGNYWPMAGEVDTVDPASLPATFGDFRKTVFEATLHLRDDADIVAHVNGRRTEDGEPVELTGRVVETVQSLLEPVTSDFPIEHSLILEVDDARVTIGGRGAFVEDIEAEEITLDVE